jgi:hypothetical protein
MMDHTSPGVPVGGKPQLPEMLETTLADDTSWSLHPAAALFFAAHRPLWTLDAALPCL